MRRYLLPILMMSLLYWSCEKDDPNKPTSVNLTFRYNDSDSTSSSNLDDFMLTIQIEWYEDDCIDTCYDKYGNPLESYIYNHPYRNQSYYDRRQFSNALPQTIENLYTGRGELTIELTVNHGQVIAADYEILDLEEDCIIDIMLNYSDSEYPDLNVSYCNELDN